MASFVTISDCYKTIFITVVVIGFIDASYVVFENDSIATVTFGVVDGTLQRTVDIDLFFTGLSAASELFRIHFSVHYNNNSSWN